MPMHGEYRMLLIHAKIASEVGVPALVVSKSNTVIPISMVKILRV